MKFPKYDEHWSDEWKSVYEYDLMEMFGSKKIKHYSRPYHNRFNTMLGMVKQYLPVGAAVLDVAAAQGNFTLSLAEAGYKMTWNDLREKLVDYVKLKYEKGNIEYLPSNILDKTGMQFDGVIVSEIIEHVAHPDVFLRSIAALVKPGGFIFLSTPLGSYMQNRLPRFSDFPNPAIFESEQFKPNSDGHIFLLYEDELNKFAGNNHLSVRKTVVQNNFLTSGHLKSRYFVQFLPDSFLRGLEKITQRLPAAIRLKIHSNISMVLQKNHPVSGA